MSDLCDLQSNIGFLWRNLQTEWSDVRSKWSDSIADEFESKYWLDLEAEMPQLLSAMEDLDEAFRQASIQLQD
jgi:hypothetical protein